MVKFAISRNLRKNFGVRLYRGEGGQPQSVQVRTRGEGGRKSGKSERTYFMDDPLWVENQILNQILA